MLARPRRASRAATTAPPLPFPITTHVLGTLQLRLVHGAADVAGLCGRQSRQQSEEQLSEKVCLWVALRRAAGIARSQEGRSEDPGLARIGVPFRPINAISYGRAGISSSGGAGCGSNKRGQINVAVDVEEVENSLWLRFLAVKQIRSYYYLLRGVLPGAFYDAGFTCSAGTRVQGRPKTKIPLPRGVADRTTAFHRSHRTYLSISFPPFL